MELTITTDRSKQWSRTLYVVDEEIFSRILQILKEENESIPQYARALRAIPSEKRRQASRKNGKRGGRPKKTQE